MEEKMGGQSREDGRRSRAAIYEGISCDLLR